MVSNYARRGKAQSSTIDFEATSINPSASEHQHGRSGASGWPSHGLVGAVTRGELRTFRTDQLRDAWKRVRTQFADSSCRVLCSIDRKKGWILPVAATHVGLLEARSGIEPLWAALQAGRVTWNQWLAYLLPHFDTPRAGAVSGRSRCLHGGMDGKPANVLFRQHNVHRVTRGDVLGALEAERRQVDASEQGFALPEQSGR